MTAAFLLTILGAWLLVGVGAAVLHYLIRAPRREGE